MTILIGSQFKDGVLFTADTKTSGLNNDGSHTGDYTESIKISQMKSNMIIATAGLSLASMTAKILRTTLLTENNLNNIETLDFCKETFQYTFNNFKRINPYITYTDGLGMLGGFDKDLGQSFIYLLSSINGFEPIKSNRQLEIFAPSEDIELQLRENITLKLPQVRTPIDLVPIFSESIRKINHESVGQETFSCLFYFDHHEKEFKIGKYSYDKDGKLK
ncbi:hypothetical protein [Cytobacillus firmus]|uniref:hypothetical protein n=1 Tax=Cytobacillus firmus TaxID=1399 RepID=UPI00300394A0